MKLSFQAGSFSYYSFFTSDEFEATFISPLSLKISTDWEKPNLNTTFLNDNLRSCSALWKGQLTRPDKWIKQLLCLQENCSSIIYYIYMGNKRYIGHFSVKPYSGLGLHIVVGTIISMVNSFTQSLYRFCFYSFLKLFNFITYFLIKLCTLWKIENVKSLFDIYPITAKREDFSFQLCHSLSH